jgi:hypothetical protein
MQATVIQTRLDAAQGPEEETRPGATQDSVVQTSSGEARTQCVDRTECSTGICSVDKPRAAQATFVQTLPGAAQAPCGVDTSSSRIHGSLIKSTPA